MNFEDLKNPELQEKLKTCKSMSELASLAGEVGVALTDDQLEAVSGGAWWDCDAYCGSKECDPLIF